METWLAFIRTVLLSLLFFSSTCISESIWRVSPDLIIKSQWLSETEPSPGIWQSVGVDAYNRFHPSVGPDVTMTVQLYYWCVEDRVRKPYVLEGTDDCKLVPKINTLNFHASGDGKFNILVGHAELPYGLEVPVSTNETLRTLMTPRDTGLKVDWGIGVNGTVSGWSYASTLTRGSGIEWKMEDDYGEEPWALSARIGTAIDSQRFLPNAGHGFSIFTARSLNPSGSLTDRWRIAFDRSDYFGPWGVLSQLSFGETEDRETYNFFAEINRSNSTERFTSYLQYKTYNEKFESEWERAQSIHLGGRYVLNRFFTVSGQLTREFDVFNNVTEQTLLDLQLRFRKD